MAHYHFSKQVDALLAFFAFPGSLTARKVAQKHLGGRFGRPPSVLPVVLLAYFFFAAFLAAFFAGFLATAFLVAIVSILPLSCRHRTCKSYFAVNECIEF
jgi:hypothetical protein